MEVILLEKVANLGNLGDKVKVRAGYGRNYLVPQKKAVPASADNIAKFEARRAELEKAAAESLAKATARGEALAKLGAVTISANAGDEGKLFGSVGTGDIADAVSKAGVAVEKREVLLPQAIHTIGEYTVEIRFHTDVVTPVKVTIQAAP